MSRPEKIVFMGTPEFAAVSLMALLDAGFNVAAVVTRPDRPRGRGRRIAPPPVKVLARKRGLRVLQPKRLRDSAFLEEIRTFKPDLIVVVAYGKILPPEVLSIPPKGCINLHASLLPKYRGASPISHAIINGEKETGVTTILMDEGMDSGPVLMSEKVAIGENDTARDLSERLAERGAALLVETIKKYLDGKLKPVAQDEEAATYAPTLKKEDGLIDWDKPASEIYNLIRGMYPWPGAFTRWRGRSLKIHRARLWEGEDEKYMDAPPGTVVFTGPDSFGVRCGLGVLEILEVQPQDKKRMSAGDFIRGYRISEGERLVF